jgi:hypothetical protein
MWRESGVSGGCRHQAVAPQAIRYPTDLSLLNEAREFSEQIIDILYPATDEKKKPRMYRRKAPNAAFTARAKRARWNAFRTLTIHLRATRMKP